MSIAETAGERAATCALPSAAFFAMPVRKVLLSVNLFCPGAYNDGRAIVIGCAQIHLAHAVFRLAQSRDYRDREQRGNYSANNTTRNP
jgi:hypothetical protein